VCVQDSAFSSNANLQNLLIITALKSAPDRVPDYIHRLEGFEPKAVAQARFFADIACTLLGTSSRLVLQLRASRWKQQHFAWHLVPNRSACCRSFAS
jgi:hypothetical protein